MSIKAAMGFSRRVVFVAAEHVLLARSVLIDFMSPSQSGLITCVPIPTDSRVEQLQPGVEKRKRSSFPPPSTEQRFVILP